MEQVQPLAQENEPRTRLERREKAMMNMASELQAATEAVRAQGKQIEELQKDAKWCRAESMMLKLHLQAEKERANRRVGENEDALDDSTSRGLGEGVRLHPSGRLDIIPDTGVARASRGEGAR